MMSNVMHPVVCCRKTQLCSQCGTLQVLMLNGCKVPPSLSNNEVKGVNLCSYSIKWLNSCHWVAVVQGLQKVKVQ